VKRATLIVAAVAVLLSPIVVLVGMYAAHLALFAWLGATGAIATPLTFVLEPRPRTPDPATIT